MAKHLTIIIFIIISNLAIAQPKEAYWPKQVEADGLVITIYAPVPEIFENNILNARAAFSIFDKAHLPVFGAMWFRCMVQTNVKDNEVYFTNIELVNADFPNATADRIENLQHTIESQVPSWHFNSNLKAFYKNINVININNEFVKDLKSNPPKIYYAQEPTVLIYIDGEPVLNHISGSELYQYVVNTPHFIVKSSSDKQYYLKGGNWWYTTADLMGTWRIIETPPSQISRLADKAYQLDVKQKKNVDSKIKPKLITTSEPAELIQTQGEPEIQQIYENLFSVTNSADEIIFDANTDYYFVLISGRWYKTKNLSRGSWMFVTPDKLPEAFKNIPADSPIAHVRMSVQGTPESVSAALDNGIPQTAVVDRFKTTMLLEYDGEPQFEPISGTNLDYGINTAGSVIREENGRYYAVDMAVWFVSDQANGPWKVSDHYPPDVKRIPPSCPVFNMKFVDIYDYDDQVVYVGYTAGYLGAFLYKGVIYFGTGYRYKSWFGDKYIPRPNTYGYGAKQKQNQTGGNVSFYAGVGMGGPMMGMGFGGYPYGYGLGMGMGYGMWNQMAYNQYYYAGQKVQIEHDIVQEKPIDLQNIYNNRAEGIVITETVRRNDPMKPVILKDRKSVPHELYADEEGHLYRQDQQGNWFERNESGWVKTSKNPRLYSENDAH